MTRRRGSSSGSFTSSCQDQATLCTFTDFSDIASQDIPGTPYDVASTPPATPSRNDTSVDIVVDEPLPAPRFSPTKTPTRKVRAISLATPPSTPHTPLHVRARALLRSTTDSFNVIGRETERKIVSSFLQPFIDGEPNCSQLIHTSLYISGSPGTGKTALVMSVLSTNKRDDVRTAYVNCMGLKDINVLWGRILPALGEPGASNKGKAAASALHRFERKLGEDAFKWCVPENIPLCVGVFSDVLRTVAILASLF